LRQVIINSINLYKRNGHGNNDNDNDNIEN